MRAREAEVLAVNGEGVEGEGLPNGFNGDWVHDDGCREVSRRL